MNIGDFFIFLFVLLFLLVIGWLGSIYFFKLNLDYGRGGRQTNGG